MANILVTGGSRGIGAAIAKKFAEQGDTVYITYCKSKEAAQVLEQQYGIHPIFADFREDFGALKAGKAIAEQIGTIDTLVNNAAISVVDVFQCVSEEDCTALYRVNLFGTVDMTRAILPTMLQQHAGNIINITSVWGQTGASCEVDYSVTKGGIIAFTKALAKEVAPSGIRVNAVSPGVIDTEMNAHLSEEDRKELAEETPLQRIGKPEEIADAVLFLASERAAFITGQILPVNGGFFI
ncbi:MAG: 3-oxoacyl-ACP reductase FabG [Ruminococcus callidus]|nr:3-oxoacyl-ACP reductase FabG [Ruminococcus sp.]MDD6946478.1 3-oxoacyl-ACP reductase FabG [Ruminococcus sp.]MDY6144909.1 3-oxoacyl-ACP reductase FabG [Ruminococcus callidus]